MMEQGMSTRRAMGYMLGAMVFVIVSLGFFKFRQISNAIAASASFAPPPEAVTASPAELSSWTPSIEIIGSIDSTQGTVLKTEEKGTVEHIGFESGSEVKAGDVLVQLDVTVEQAQLKTAEAKADLARVNYKRAQLLKAGNAMAEAAVDEAAANMKETEGEVLALKATIAKKTIVAPFSGRAGIRMVNLGQYVSEGADIVPLFSYDPLYANFTVPQVYLKSLSPGQTVRLHVDAYEGREFTGVVSAVDPQVDPTTRNIRVQATLANPDSALRPGMFAHIELLIAGDEKHVTVPGSAIYHAPYGDSVFVVENQKSPDGKEFLGVTQKFVKVGPRRGDQIAVLQGLEPGQMVATSGLFKLRPGAAVNVNNSISPKNDPAPRPPDT